MRQPARKPSSALQSAVPAARPVRIDRIGAEGDGVGAFSDGTPVYVPFTLPGETVIALPLRKRGDGWLARAEAVEPGAERVEPPCAYFGRCGGCALQHWHDTEYRDWKSGLVTAALRRAGFADLPPVAFVQGLPGERRRLDFAVRRERGRIVFGLHEAGSPDIVDLGDCLVLHPTLMGLIAPLRELFAGLQGLRGDASVIINLLASGPDILLRSDAVPSITDRTTLAGFARSHGVPRISWAMGNEEPEPVCAIRPAITALSGVEVAPPPGAFLQATAEGEAAIVAAVLDGLPIRRTARLRVAELYAGSGTLTLALAQHIRVAAWEGDVAAAAALRQAVNRSGLVGKVEVAQRDLVRQPISAKELGGFAAVVLDPPHAGAIPQITQIAAARPPTVIYVSCNPSSLGRDAATLRAAGYRLSAATAIDQFLWSPRLEAVCVFHFGSP